MPSKKHPTHTGTEKHTHKQIPQNTRTHTYSPTQSHTHTHTRTDTHTPTLIPVFLVSLSLYYNCTLSNLSLQPDHMMTPSSWMYFKYQIYVCVGLHCPWAVTQVLLSTYQPLCIFCSPSVGHSPVLKNALLNKIDITPPSYSFSQLLQHVF